MYNIFPLLREKVPAMISAVAETMLIPTVSPMKTDANITLDIVQRYEKTLAELKTSKKKSC